MRDAMAALPPEQREVGWLHVWKHAWAAWPWG
jgi:hypothetical protein